MISFLCSCGRALRTRDDLAGKELKCPGCGNPVRVPGSSASSPAAPQAASGGSPAVEATTLGPAPLELRAAPAPASPSGEGTGGRRLRIALPLVGGLALLSFLLNVILFATRGGTAPPAAPSRTDESKELAELRNAVRDRELELSTLRSSPPKGSDSERYEKLTKLVDDLEQKRSALDKDMAQLTLERDALAVRVTELEARSQAAAAHAPAEAPKPKADPALSPAPSPEPLREKSLAELVEKHTPAVIVVRTDKGAGAGFFLTPDGFAATNHHVIAGSQKITVEHLIGDPKSRRKMSYAAIPYAIDLKNDLALLRITVADPVPTLEVISADAVRVGDPVFAIGNPGVGDTLLEMSVSSGILSSLARKIDERRLLQTTAPINPGNSGGPLFTMTGKVVGIVTAKAKDRENIGFAVPAELAQALFEKRESPELRVTGSLSEWEAKNVPASRLKIDSTLAIPIGSTLTRMMLEEENDRILAIDYDQNSLLVVSISQRKILSKTFVGSEPSQLLRHASMPKNVVWVANRASRNLVKVDLDRGALTETVPLSFSPLRIEPTKSFLWCLDDTGRVHLVSLTEKKELKFSPNADPYNAVPFSTGIVYDPKRDRMILVSMTGLTEMDATKANTHLAELATKGEIPGRPGMVSNETMKAINAIRTDLMKSQKTYNLWRNEAQPPEPFNPNRNFLPLAPRTVIVSAVLLDEKASRLYVRRACLKLDKLDIVVGSLKTNPYSMSEDPALRDFMARNPALDQVVAASPDGKWVVTGTHLMNAEHFVLHKEIPLPTLVAAFSKDSKTLFFFDWINNQIARFAVE